MRSLLAVVVACLLSSAAGFRTAVSTPRFHGRRSAAAPPARATTATTRTTTMMAEPPNNNENNNNNNKPGLGAALSKLPLNSALSVFLIVTSARDLVREVPLLGGAGADFFGTACDVGFLGYAASQLLSQIGVAAALDDADGAPTMTLDGLECCVTLNVGREPNTWMDKEWAASGGRLALPLNLRFSDEPVDLGFPGEEALGGRYARRLECTNEAGGRFVGPQGEVVVPVESGAWAALPIAGARRGERKVRFFLDFPVGAARNDVTLPAGRVFFSGVCVDGDGGGDGGDEAAASPGWLLPDAALLAAAPGGARLLAQGGLTIKKNDGLGNLYGALGDVNLILGRFSASAPR